MLGELRSYHFIRFQRKCHWNLRCFGRILVPNFWTQFLLTYFFYENIKVVPFRKPRSQYPTSPGKLASIKVPRRGGGGFVIKPGRMSHDS